MPAAWGVLAATLLLNLAVQAEDLPKRTTLSNRALKFKTPDKHYVVMKRGDVTAVIVDNHAVDDDVLPGHRAGYSGLASLTHVDQSKNMFVPAYAGLNFEHIHDGTVQNREILFEPRHAEMELRVIDAHTAELYQPATPHFGLESCHRYQMLEDGTIEMTFECIPRRKTFQNGYIGLFWASYINQPESLDIHFKGGPVDEPRTSLWVRGITPSHGVLCTHLARSDERRFSHDDEFPLSLVFNRSRHRFDEPWYFGVNGSMALALMFRNSDQPRLTQSPSGGGRGNPAWDFQFLVPNYQVDQRYQMVMRASYVPFVSADQVERATDAARQEINPPK